MTLHLALHANTTRTLRAIAARACVPLPASSPSAAVGDYRPYPRYRIGA